MNDAEIQHVPTTTYTSQVLQQGCLQQGCLQQVSKKNIGYEKSLHDGKWLNVDVM